MGTETNLLLIAKNVTNGMKHARGKKIPVTKAPVTLLMAVSHLEMACPIAWNEDKARSSW